MGLFSPGPRARHKRFHYEPRYYNPERDEGIKRRMRIQSKVRRTSRRPISLIVLILLLSIAFWIILQLGS